IQNQKPFHFQLFGVALASAAPVAGGEGKYTHGSYDNGKYNPKTRNSGRYVHDVMPYMHIRIYHHIPNPYDGGYGPYFGIQNPYVHDGRGTYVPPPVSTRAPQYIDIPVPAIKLEYGFPDISPKAN
uniref:Uncharacterized protein n=1 Tax=Megaselia scalaris TaxID=36166 RepID=T1GAG3_MEGSC